MPYVWMNAAYRVHRRKPVIFLFSRDKNRERTVVIVQNFRPYFFVPDDQSDIIDIFGRPVRKVYTELPSDVPKERQKYSFSDEADIQFFLRYLIDVNVRSAFEVQGGKEQISKTGIRCILVDHNVDSIVPVDDFEVPPKVLYFDIEVTSPTGIFPRPSDPRFPIASIQCSSNYHDRIDVFLLVDNPNLQKYVESNLVFEKYGHEVHLHPFDDDRPLLLSFVKFVQQEDPDVLTAYNGSLFDMPYLLRRAERLRISLQGMSPLGTVNAQAHRGFSDVYIKGRDFIDFFAAYRKWGTGRQGVQSDQPFGVTFDFKRVCAAEAGFYYEDLGDRVEEAMRTTPEEWVEYCINDAYALKLLDEKTGIIQHFDRLRRIVGVPISWSLSNKKLIDTEILRESDRPLPTMVPQEDAEVQGAIVKLPPPGVHENVACFDLKSIYPSVIISFNLSAETKDPKGEIFVTDYWRFKREPEGIIPKVTRKYMEERERLRALRKKLTGKEHDRVRQLETLYKFLACSIYGVNAYRYFRMFDPEVANAITYLGRLALTRCEKMLAKNGYQVIYEDSVTPETPIFVQRDGLIDIIPICEVNVGEVIWSATGWTHVRDVIRKPVRKPIVTVVTPEMLVNCTVDHSLVDPSGNPVRPYDADYVMVKEYPRVQCRCDVDRRLAWILGVFTADGSRIKANQYVINGSEKVCRRAKRLLAELGVKTYLHDYRDSSKTWRLVISRQCPYNELFEDTYTETGWRKIPRRILNASLEAVRAFLDGFYEGDFSKTNTQYRYKYVSVDSKHPCVVVGLTFLVERLTGQSWNIYKSKQNTGIQIRFRTPNKKRKGPRRYPPGKVKSVKSVDEFRWTKTPFNVGKPTCVYDLSTESETFCVGKLVLHNTDSLFVKMKTKLRREVNVVEYLLNEELRQFARIYGAKYPPVIKFERLFKRILFKTREKGKSAKKRYAGVDERGNLYIIGFEPRRSSTAEITRTTMKKFFEKVLVEEDIDGAIKLVREVWQNLPKYPIQKVAVPKGLQKTVYKVKNPWIVGKEYAEKYFGKVFREDKKPRLVYVKQVIGKPPTHAICLTEDDTELPPGVIVDWKRMREVTIKKPFEGLLASIGYDFSVIEKGIQQQSLGRYLESS